MRSIEMHLAVVNSVVRKSNTFVSDINYNSP